LAWLRERQQPLVSLREAYKDGPYSIRDKATATKVLNILEDHGHLVRIKGGTEIDGAHRRDVWRIVQVSS
jgi:hypothetical protein